MDFGGGAGAALGFYSPPNNLLKNDIQDIIIFLFKYMFTLIALTFINGLKTDAIGSSQK